MSRHDANKKYSSGQKFIARNRAPRVQIEYDVELYGSDTKVELPFVMGVMSDLVGQSHVPVPDLSERKFMEIDIDNFDDRMKALKPRVAFQVDNTLTHDGKLAVDLEFESMDDFSPTAIANQVEPLRELLKARTELSNLLSYMDGKNGAEELIAKLLADNDLLKSLAAKAKETPVAQNAAVTDTLEQHNPTDTP